MPNQAQVVQSASRPYIGTGFYERAIGEANEAEAAAQCAGAGLEGRFPVSVPVMFSRVHLVRELGSFLDAHPEY